MDLTQRKLTRAEWSSIELPISDEELRITTLIKEGYHNVNIKKNSTMSLLSYMKVQYSECIDNYVYTHYLQNILLEMGKKYQLSIIPVEKNKVDNICADTELIRAYSNPEFYKEFQKYMGR